uniref:CCHC-type domain-containing protein n=1 Tax=Fagus sylvatica TaxID=28930 RepID=A0A2N9G2U3_FAGSY
MECNVFLFTFENPSDLKKVFRKRPWTLRGAHLVLKKWAPDLLGVGFKYEKLPDVCYNCGVIWHLAKNCGVPPTTISNQFGVRFLTFGDWLSAVKDVVPPQIYEKNCYAAQVDLDSDGHTDARNRILVTCPSAFPNPSNDNTILAHSTCLKTIDSIISGPNNNMSLGKAIVVSELVANNGRSAATSQDVLTQQVLGGEWCSAVDLGFSSNKFNWCNRRWGKGCIRERLDRSIASTEWRVLFPKTVLYHLRAIRSDHAPLLLDTNPCDFFSPRPFRFEAAWLRDPSCSEEAKLQGELNEWLARYDTIWKQKSREIWLRDGDRNTKLFHLSTIIRRRHNAINAIRNDAGGWILDKKEIGQHIREKFKVLFTEEEISCPPNLGNLMPPVITSYLNVDLCNIPTVDEIIRVIFYMQDLKAPGPDGLPPLFYKKFWPTVSSNVINAVQDFFVEWTMLKELNSTFIVLIPNTQNPTSVNHYRPISLCNVMYKAITKILGGFVAIKVDLQKAYDRINWGFLKPVLSQLGFSPTFVNWILQCVSTVSTSVLVNGGRNESFNPSRGLHQGDPLSPYLFILCQKINREKSRVIFSKLVTHEVKRWVKEEMQVKKLPLDAFYLGTPMFFSRNRTRDYKYLIDRIDSKLMGWRCKALSWAGRCTLIKSVALALPTYYFSTDDVPISVCNKMDSTIRRFWWNPKKDKGNYLAWKSWDSLCHPKDEGGLDFRKSKAFNQALLAKIDWWVVVDRDSICVRALHSKYKVDEDWLGSEPRKNASHLWRTIEKLCTIIKMGACFLVGDGLSIDMWKDPWVPWLEGFTPKSLHANDPNTPIRVSNLFYASNRSWKTNVLQQLVDQHSLAAILKIPIPMHAPQDKLIWTLSPSGCFSVKSAISSCLAPTSSSLEFLELVINPPICTDPRITPKSLRAQTSIQFALTLESIWLLRNQVVHNDGKLNHLAIVENLEARVLEHWFILNPLLGVVARTMNPPSWSVPPSNVLKLNVDAALKDGVATLAVVVRNDMGHVINGWAKKVETTDPATVEAAALLWALEIAVENKFTKIVVEGDAKLCIDAITIETTSIPWRIHNLVHIYWPGMELIDVLLWLNRSNPSQISTQVEGSCSPGSFACRTITQPHATASRAPSSSRPPSPIKS